MIHNSKLFFHGKNLLHFSVTEGWMICMASIYLTRVDHNDFVIKGINLSRRMVQFVMCVPNKLGHDFATPE